MNILIDPLPESLTVGGKVYRIDASFRAGIAFELAVLGEAEDDAVRLLAALGAFFGKNIPEDIPAAVDAALWFYRCGSGNEQAAGEGKKLAKPCRAYDFGQDAGRIYAAFLEVYHIDLTRTDLHWWLFRELLFSLPESCELRRIMACRTAELGGLDKATRQYYQRMRARFALKPLQQFDSLEERDRQWMREVDAAYLKAESKLK